jgi:3-phosphoshikimate 1-carboxyvinyltransferase
MGVHWVLDGATLLVDGRGFDGIRPIGDVVDCGNSATTMRLLTGAAAATGIPIILDGTPSLRRRPMKRIIEPLRLMGVEIDSDNGCAPLRLLERRNPLQAIDHNMPVASAQVKSAILIAGLAAPGVTLINEPGPSRDHTERMLRRMGVAVENLIVRDTASRITRPGFNLPVYTTRMTVQAALRLQPLNDTLPGDISSAAFLIVGALITPGSSICIRNICLNPTRTGLLEVLQSMGAKLVIEVKGEQAGEPCGDIQVGFSELYGTEVSGSTVVRMIDEFPALAIAAAFAVGETKVCEADELRHKESDRITALCEALNLLGVDIQETSDGFRVRGGYKITGGEVAPASDHRLAMSLALVGLAASGPVTVHGAQIIEESFPQFIGVLEGLGSKVRVGQ